jgi:hypothetical protein
VSEVTFKAGYDSEDANPLDGQLAQPGAGVPVFIVSTKDAKCQQSES